MTDHVSELRLTKPTLVAVCERVYAQRRALFVTGTRPENYVVHVACNLWRGLMLEVGSDPATIGGHMFGLKTVVDNTLDDDQIRLRHEVVA